MLRIGKSIAGLSGKASRSSRASGISSSLKSFRYTSPGAGNSSFRCFSATTAVTDIATDKTVPPELVPINIEKISDGIAQLTSSDLGYWPSHFFMQAIENVHHLSGVPYWEAIVLTTVGIRLMVFPLSVITIKSAAAMAAMKPHMEKIKVAYERNPYAQDPHVKAKYDIDVKNMFKEYKVNPLKSLAMPLIQVPLFLSFYLALSNMQTYYPGYVTGGESWFIDLSVADPFYIFPFINALTFLLMIELGSEGFQTENQDMFKWVR